MHSLETIRRINAEAVAALNITELRARGCYVVVEYAGLHVMDCLAFSGHEAEAEARAKLAELNASGSSTRGVLHEPSPQILGTFPTLASELSMAEHKAQYRDQVAGGAGA